MCIRDRFRFSRAASFGYDNVISPIESVLVVELSDEGGDLSEEGQNYV